MTAKKTHVPRADLVRGAWEWCADVGEETGLAVVLSLKPSPRRGVFDTVARLVRVVDGRPAGVVVQVRGQYPSSDSETLEGHILKLTVRLDAARASDGLGDAQAPA